MPRLAVKAAHERASVKFAPATSPSLRSPVIDGYTTSPQPHNAALRRSGTVADRINEKLRAASVSKPLVQSPHRPFLSAIGKTLPPPPTDLGDEGSPTKEDAFIPPTEPNGKPVIPSVNPTLPRKETPNLALRDLGPPPILLSGLSLPEKSLHDLLGRFDAHLTSSMSGSDNSTQFSSGRSSGVLVNRQRSTMFGTYEKTFSGEELVEWLSNNVEGFGGDWDRCADAAGELSKMGYLGRVGVGRGFEASGDTFYTLKDSQLPSNSLVSPLSPSKSANLQSMFKSYLPSSLGTSDEPAHVRLRREANKADEAYKEGVRTAEERRLEMEERIEQGLRVWERWERERLGVINAGQHAVSCTHFVLMSCSPQAMRRSCLPSSIPPSRPE